jgi:NAD-dependent SIR2 family protein deacetylase
MTDFRDIIIKLAFTIYSSPGVYALLLGSGISKDAGIPTGWEITLDLIRKIAIAEKAEPKDLEKWYQERYHESPDYTKLLKKLTKTSTDRANLLRSYFQPKAEERGEGLKIPTLAHKCIAILVKYGYIRIILTTNFDRLLEEALSEQGITPTIISTEDEMKGAMPFVHNNCTIIKLHGDYMNTRIKNTPEELAKYPKKVDKYLDRVLDEFGLIICGWSAEYDTALRNALYRRKNRRFPIYWTVKDKLNDEATRVSNHLISEQIPIESANQLFSQLLEKVEALKDIEKPHPLSFPLAITTTKRYLSEEKYDIKLRDLVIEETERIYTILNSKHFEVEGIKLEKAIFQNRMNDYEIAVNIIMGILNTIVYYGKGKYVDLITNTIERILWMPKDYRYRDGLTWLKHYPALFLTYSIGIISIATENYRALAALLLKTNYIENDEKKKAIEVLNVNQVFYGNYDKWVPYPDAEKKKTPASEYMFKIMNSLLENNIPDEKKYEEFFDIFEYLTGLIYVDLMFEDVSPENIRFPIGRFSWKYYGFGSGRGCPKLINDFIENGLKQGQDWPLLKTGFFKGSVERFKECRDAYEYKLKEISKSWF